MNEMIQLAVEWHRQHSTISYWLRVKKWDAQHKARPTTMRVAAHVTCRNAWH